ncbi:serine hydrolase domain-containing protein [Phycicoccus sonneratiae]|uniref:Serine hydrolase n=1 Tax=Phycicoccus sonneratiae TaxID=2807628 RepID=A0ABS2CSH5_9MICO|nr:serine hydrolase [Phycicoccus sonneraticus]MBM6402433.1 serine hydrolase [Phycicoccus sonneraticus]
MTDADTLPPTTDGLPRSTPEEQGVPSGAVLAMVRRWEELGVEPHSVVVQRHGHVVAEGYWAPYARDGIALMYSVSKTFTALAVGLAVGEGLLRPEDRVVDLFPEAAHVAGPRAAVLTLHDLLAMRTGHRTDTLVHRVARPADFPESFLATEPEEEPGSFVYHNGATLLAGMAVQRRSGQRLLDYLRPRLLDPLGIEDAAWLNDHGIDQGFSGLHVSTTALGRVGELVLRDGVWQGRRVVPEGWIGRMTTNWTDTTTDPGTLDWQQGYGYQMWHNVMGGVRLDGAFGQFSVVVPEADLVVALTECTDHAQDTLTAIREVLLPTLTDDALPADEAAQEALTGHLAAAEVPHPSPAPDVDPGAGPWSFAHEPTADVTALTRVDVARGADGWAVTLTEGERVTEVPCGDGRWPAADDAPFVGAAAWTAPDVFQARLCALRTPHVLTLRCSGDAVTASWNGQPLTTPVLGVLRPSPADAG